MASDVVSALRRLGSRRIFAAALLATLALAPVARADEPTPAEKETARQLMAEGRAARDRGELAAALKSFQGADAIMHVPTTSIAVAQTQAAIGQLVEARDTALKIVRMPWWPNEPTIFKDARTKAELLTEELELRIPAIKITLASVPPGATPTVTIDDRPVPAAALGLRQTVDPGHHVVVARIGKVEGSKTVDIAEREKKEVTIEMPPEAAAEWKSMQAAAAKKKETQKQSGSHWLAYVGFGAAGVGALAGTVTGLMSMSDVNKAKNSGDCNATTNQCLSTQTSTLQSATTTATISTVSFVVAAAGVVVGIVGLTTGGPEASPEKDRATPMHDAVTVRPWIGLGSAGVSGSF